MFTVVWFENENFIWPRLEYQNIYNLFTVILFQLEYFMRNYMKIKTTTIELWRHTMDLISTTHNQHYENYRYLVLGTLKAPSCQNLSLPDIPWENSLSKGKDYNLQGVPKKGIHRTLVEPQCTAQAQSPVASTPCVWKLFSWLYLTKRLSFCWENLVPQHSICLGLFFF